jgi:hypothetical protein
MSKRLRNIPSEYLSRRSLAAAKLKDSTPSDSESFDSFQRLIQGKIDRRGYINLQHDSQELKSSNKSLQSDQHQG